MKKSLAFLSGICLALSSGLASTVTLNGWNVGNPTPVGATGLVNATKNVGGVAKVSNASIVPNASQVSKILRGGVAGVALTVAVNELLDGIDWVMDPANNQIRYKKYEPTTGSYFKIMASFNAVNCNGYDMPLFNSINEATTHISTCFQAIGWGIPKCERITSILYTCSASKGIPIEIRFYGTQNEIDKTLPLDTVSQKVIDNAQSGNTDAQVATVSAAQNILNDAQNDAEKAKPIVLQLEANAIIAGNALYPNLDIKNLTLIQAKEIYRNDWWNKLGADQLHPAIVYQLWDFAVNAGKSRAIKELQQAVGVSDDGIIGPKTIAVVKAKDVNDVLLLLASERLKFYTSLSTWGTYGKGWTNRVAENLKYAAEDN